MRDILGLLLLCSILSIACTEKVKFNTQGDLPLVFTIDEEGYYNLKYITPSLDQNKIDVLFFIDTSGSMTYEQEQIGNRLSSFTSQFSGTDWRIALSTTNITNDAYPGSHGSLINMNGFNYITPSTPNSSTLFKDHLKRPISCSADCNDHERGIYNAALAVLNPNSRHFFRDYSHVHFVFVSDEDENSNGQNLETYDQPQNLVQMVQGTLRPLSFTAHSIINRPDDIDCLASHGNSYGNVYKSVADLTQGVVGDVCAADYSAQLSEISTKIFKKTSSFDLPCKPNQSDMEISFTDPNISSSWNIVGKNLIFEPALPVGSEVNVKFKCE